MTEEGLGRDDREADIPGVYRITLTGSEATSLSRSQQAAAALDVFHEDVAIHGLDDFEIEVVEDDGSPIEGALDHDSYTWKEGGSIEKIAYEPLSP